MNAKTKKGLIIGGIVLTIAVLVTLGVSIFQSNAHEHEWGQITGTVHHSEISHKASYCGGCNEEITDIENEHVRQCPQTHKTESYYQRYIVDSPAYDEPIVIGYRCSICGETKDA